MADVTIRSRDAVIQERVDEVRKAQRDNPELKAFVDRVAVLGVRGFDEWFWQETKYGLNEIIITANYPWPQEDIDKVTEAGALLPEGYKLELIVDVAPPPKRRWWH